MFTTFHFSRDFDLLKKQKNRSEDMKFEPSLVSVIIPVFYSASCLNQTLQALLEVDYPERKIEIIFSYYPSGDSTHDIIIEFATQHKTEFYDIRVLECLERGLSYARNLAIKNSLGEYIFLLDDDVLIHRETFKYALQILASEPKAALVAFPYIHSGPNIYERAAFFRFTGKVSKAETFPIGASMVRRGIFDEIGLFNENLGYPYSVHEELEIAARIRKKGHLIFVDGRLVQEHLSKERNHPDSLGFPGLNSPQPHLVRLVAKEIRNYFTRYADSYHIVLLSAPKKWKAELIAHFFLPLPFFVLMFLNFYFGIVYLLSLAISAVIYYRAFKPSFIYLPFIILLGRIARSYGYVTRRIFVKLSLLLKIK
jgi:glycosyltransferase involved in cell wall biosynthesis